VSLDFKAQPDPSREAINQWVEKQTRDMIKNLLAPGVIKKDTELVLTNAVYFKGSWLQAFKKSLTKDGEFQVSPSKKKTVPFMNQKAKFPYMENSELQAVRLPYKGSALAMEIVLPKVGVELDAIEKKLSVSGFEELWKLPFLTEVEISLPKFKAESSFELAPTISAMGMPLAFDRSKANFQGIRKPEPGKNLYISHVIHKAFADVNEEGTEAAAATAVVMTLGGGMLQAPKVFKADRPFLYFIRDLRSGAILFMGRYAQP
jgi:serpin B